MTLMMSNVADRAYGRMVEVDASFDDAIEQATAALKEQGFGVLTTIAVDQVLKEKIGVERDRYMILGACNPNFANKALEADIDIGLLLPCNVVVREENDRRYVTFVDPKAMLAAAGSSDELEAIAADVRARLDAAADTLAAR
jgi:uncharacterized protein (DUF302 family)